MPQLSPKEIASIQADFAATVLSDTCAIYRRTTSGSEGTVMDGGYTRVGTDTWPCLLTARIRQPDPDPEHRSYASSAKVNTEDERHLWVAAGCPVQRSDKLVIASTGNSYIVTNFVDDYTPMPGVMCAVQKMKA